MKRRISAFESTYFKASQTPSALPLFDVAIYIGTTVGGDIEPAILGLVLQELARAHPMLGGRVVEEADGTLSIKTSDDFSPSLDIIAGGQPELLGVVDCPPDWSSGLFRAYLLRGGQESTVLLAIHHGIADGRSASALLNDMWLRYTAHACGAGIPVEPPQTLPEATDAYFAATTDDRDVAELRQQLTEAVESGGLQGLVTLPTNPNTTNSDRRFGIERIDLTAEDTSAFLQAARDLDVTANSLLMSCAVLAIRSQLARVDHPLPLMCGYTADMRPWLDPPLPQSVVINAAFGSALVLPVGLDSTVADIAPQVHTQLRAAIDRRDPVRYLLARQSANDEAAAAILATRPALLISNIGAISTPTTPAHLRIIRTELFVVGPEMPPTMLMLTQDGRLMVQLEYDSRLHGTDQMAGVRRALAEMLRCPESLIKPRLIRSESSL